MSSLLKPAFALMIALPLLGCATAEPGDAPHRVIREAQTGSNIPRHDSQADVQVIDKDAVPDLFRTNGTRGKGGG